MLQTVRRHRRLPERQQGRGDTVLREIAAALVAPDHRLLEGVSGIAVDALEARLVGGKVVGAKLGEARHRLQRLCGNRPGSGEQDDQGEEPSKHVCQSVHECMYT